MSRTTRNGYEGKGKSPGYDFWSRRCFGVTVMSYGKVAKWITRHKERARNRRMRHKAMKDHEDFEKRFPGE